MSRTDDSWFIYYFVRPENSASGKSFLSYDRSMPRDTIPWLDAYFEKRAASRVEELERQGVVAFYSSTQIPGAFY
jgi:hypothetical protein